MRNIFIFILFIGLFGGHIGLVSAFSVPDNASGPLNDYANIFDESTKSELNKILSDFDSTGKGTVVVVTVPDLEGYTIESLAVEMFEKWGIGDSEKDDGLLLLIAPNDKMVRIEVGYGLEGYITDAYTSSVIRNIIIPKFRNDDFRSGTLDGLEKIIRTISDENQVYIEEVRDSGSGLSNISWSNIFEWILVGIFFVGSLIYDIFAKTKSWWLGGVVGALCGVIIGFIVGFIYIGIISIFILTIIGFIFDFIASRMGPRDPRGPLGGMPFFIGGFGGRGRGGGGFGGFGGGGSGGGGSSGGW